MSRRIGLRHVSYVARAAAIPTIRFQLREHDLGYAQHPDIRFLKPDPSVLRVDSYEGTFYPQGNGYVFRNFARSWLQGKKVRVRWSAYAMFLESYNIRISVFDGSYDRASMVDFPDPGFMILKGSGELAVIAWTRGPFDWTVLTSGVLNLSAGVLDDCCLMVRLNDYASYRKFWVDLDYIDILDAAESLLRREHFTASPTMEVTGTYHDYGYISSD